MDASRELVAVEPRALVQAVGRAIRILRDERGLSQMALWRRCNTHFNYIGGIERGEREPSVRAIADIACGLGVSPIEIFELADRLLRGEGPRAAGPREEDPPEAG